MAKSKKLDKIIKEIEEQYGKDAFDKSESLYSWGIKSVDDILGGLPNRIVELFGNEGCGKTTLALHAIADIQKKGKRGVFIDAEGGMSDKYAKAIGVDTDKWVYIRKTSMEDNLNIICKLLQSTETGIVVLDSLAALVPKVVSDDFLVKEDFNKKHVADRARLLSESLPMLMGLCVEYGNTLIIINQVRDKVGIMFGNPLTTPGGKALKHMAMQRIQVNYTEKIKKGEKIIGKKVKIVAVKNKIASPDNAVILNLIYGKGMVESDE